MGNQVVSLKIGAPLAKRPLPAISPKRQARIWLIQDFYLGGMKIKEIAAYFHISRRQVHKDLKDVRRLNQALVQDFDSDAVLGREVVFLEQLRRKAMREHSLASQEAVRLGALRLAAEISSRLICLFQSSGLMKEVPQRMQLEAVNPFTDPSFRQRFTDLMLEARREGVEIKGL